MQTPNKSWLPMTQNEDIGLQISCKPDRLLRDGLKPVLLPSLPPAEKPVTVDSKALLRHDFLTTPHEQASRLVIPNPSYIHPQDQNPCSCPESQLKSSEVPQAKVRLCRGENGL